jgi:predicted dinucleotide-binding enzyme
MSNDVSNQADFSYESARDAAGPPVRVTMYGGDAGVRAQIAADLGEAGFRSIDGGSVAMGRSRCLAM